MRFYFLAMSLRFLCVMSLFWVRGWWVILPLLGAVLLPYFGVMIANAIAANNENTRTQVVPPLALQGSSPSSEGSETKIIVVDAPAERRRTTPTHNPEAPAATQEADAETETASEDHREDQQ